MYAEILFIIKCKFLMEVYMTKEAWDELAFIDVNKRKVNCFIVQYHSLPKDLR